MSRVGTDPMAGVSEDACTFEIDGGAGGDEWLARRWESVGASWAAALLDEDQYHQRDAAEEGMSSRAMLLRKWRERRSIPTRPTMHWGSYAEPWILQTAAHILGVPMIRTNHMYRSRVWPHMSCTLDGWCLPDRDFQVAAHPEFLIGRTDREVEWLGDLRHMIYRLGAEHGPGLVEVKMKMAHAVFKPRGGEKDPALQFDYGPAAHGATWGAPRQHAYQLQHQLAVCGDDHGGGPQWSVLVALIGGMDFRAWVVMRDHGFARALGAAVERFWEQVHGTDHDLHPG
ncbi:MAG: YqaJ viral recombinase family protein [bacterium]|nr:YqaJ viral recombinase family protein [bacterium]